MTLWQTRSVLNIGVTSIGKWSFVSKTAVFEKAQFLKKRSFWKGVVFKNRAFWKGAVFENYSFQEGVVFEKRGFQKGAVFKNHILGLKTQFLGSFKVWNCKKYHFQLNLKQENIKH